MIDFHAPALADKAWVDELLALGNYRGCDYNFTNLYVWQRAYRFGIARVENFLMTHLHGRAGCSYMYPAGSGDIAAAIRALEADAAERGEPLRLVCLTPPQMAELEEFFPGRFTCTADRDGYDYLYDIDRLADLGGKKLHAKRNHIHRLDEACPGWTWAPLTPEDVAPCLAMDAAWHQAALARETVRGLSSLDDEHNALVLALEHFQTLGLEGIVLRWQGEILGFTLGAPLTETIFDVHFERARGEVQGAYPAVNRSFAQYVRQRHLQVRYLDREDDMGLPGLRKAKLSYYPDYLQVNYCAVETRAPR